MMYKELISVILPTYNWPKALLLVLKSLEDQSDKNFEIIITDDGSTADTGHLISEFKKDSKMTIHHLWQEDIGFRASKARNMGIVKAKGKYIIFLDGDCIVRPDFIKNHRILAEEGFFVAGNRSMLQKKFTDSILKNKLSIHNYSLLIWLIKKLKGGINRWHSLLVIGLTSKKRFKNKNKWIKGKSCNLSIWQKDLLAVKGFEEMMEGWGYEDTDLLIRLYNYGVRRKSGKFATTVLHLWHKEADRGNALNNKNMLVETLNNKNIYPKRGI